MLSQQRKNMAEETAYEQNGTEPRIPSSWRNPNPRQNPSRMCTPPGSPLQQQDWQNRGRQAQGPPASPGRTGVKPGRGGESSRGAARPQSSRRGGRWREKGHGGQGGPGAPAGAGVSSPRSMAGSANPPPRGTPVTVVDHQNHIADARGVAEVACTETFVGRWREKADVRGQRSELQREPEIIIEDRSRVVSPRKRTVSETVETFVGRWGEKATNSGYDSAKQYGASSTTEGHSVSRSTSSSAAVGGSINQSRKCLSQRVAQLPPMPLTQDAISGSPTQPSTRQKGEKSKHRNSKLGSKLTEIGEASMKTEKISYSGWGDSKDFELGSPSASSSRESMKPERIHYSGWSDSNDFGRDSPSAIRTPDSTVGSKSRVDQGGWDDHTCVDNEIVANGASGWDDFVETTETQSSERWYKEQAAYDSLNASDFDCCDTHVEILGKKVLVTVAATAATIEKWLNEQQGERSFGFDIEWKPTRQKGDYHNTAILQLSVENRCLLVQLLFVDFFPESLKSLLADANVTLGGVGIKADAKKLKDDHGLVCKGEVELGELASQVFEDMSLAKAGIVTLTEKVLGITHKKNRRVTMSNWEIRDLTYEQIRYGATDAWLSYSLLMVLCKLRLYPGSLEQSEPMKRYATV